MTKYKTDSLISVFAEPTEENTSTFNRKSTITPESVLKEAFSKITLPMPIYLNYGDTVVGKVLSIYESNYNGYFSIGAVIDLDSPYNYVSVGYSCSIKSKAEDVLLIESAEIQSFSAFNVTGYYDVAEIYEVE